MKFNPVVKIVLIVLLSIWSIPLTITGIIETAISKDFPDFIVNIILLIAVGILPGFFAYKIFKTLPISVKIIKPIQKPVKKDDAKAEFRIEYCDRKGKLTERDICDIISRGFEENIYIDCYCFSAQAERTFKVINIKKMIDLNTGQLIDNPMDFICKNFEIK